MVKRWLVTPVCSFLLLIIQSGCLWAIDTPSARVTVKVVDETGTPVEQAKVRMTTQAMNYAKGKFGYINKIGQTDSDGLYTGGAPAFDRLSYGVSKEGYYDSVGVMKFKEKKLGRWQPWNPTVDLVLRKIQNPVPIYARDTRWSGMEIPVVGEPIGFDLTAYDWVAPYGKGEYSDFIFKLERRVTSWDDYDSTLTLTFSNPLDGIQRYKDDRRYGSDFKLPRFAPESGYKKELELNRKMIPGDQFTPAIFKANFEEDDNYFFRIRSEEKDGKLVRAMYGKIQREMRFDPRGTETAVIHFKYYLNPDYTRNMEYDPKQNLFKDLPERERVRLK